MLKFSLSADEIRERPYWRVLLSNDENVYQWDYDTEGNEVNSWKDLKKYVENEKLSIRGAWLFFRDHSEEVGVDKDGYFFVYSVMADAFSGFHQYYYIVGYLEDGVVKTKKWMVPEMISLDEEIRATDSFGMDEMLIVNNQGKLNAE